MTIPRTAVSSERLHATCVAIDGRGVLLSGRSGSGKSDLALRLIDRGAGLVADDATLVCRTGEGLEARAPDRAGGRMEVRGVGIVTLDPVANAPVALLVDLDAAGERLPPVEERRFVAGVSLPVLCLDATAASAPIKVEWALKALGG